MGERYSGGGLDLASYQTLQGGRGVRKVFWNSSSPEAARLDQFERRLEVFLRNPIIEGTIVASSFSTAETGRRVEILADSAARVRFYSGEAGETDNGVINTQSFGGREIANWVPPELGSNGTFRAQISLYARDGSNTSWARFFADDLEFTAADETQFFNGGGLSGYIDSLGRIRWDNAILGPVGSVSSPTFSFEGYSSTGVYANSVGSDIRFTVLGTLGALVHAGGVRAVDGSASEPSIGFFNDTNNGLWRFGSDEVRMATGGSSRMAWNNSGTSLITASVATNVTVTRNASTGLLTVVSSSRDTKENFSLPEDTSWVLNLQAIEYEYIGSGWKQLGFIAEEVAEAYPQAGVHHDGPGEGKIADFDTRAVLAALQNEVKKLRAEVDALRSRRP